MNSRWTLRVNRFAAAIDMIAAGTSAPMAMADSATPANQLGNTWAKKCGTASCGLANPSAPKTDVFLAIAAKPSRARRASISEYVGRIAALRRITLRDLLDKVAVIACGYMNNAIAEPNAS